MNTCDKCGTEMDTLDLIWITAEDFVPREGEYVTVEMLQKYNALCEPCYLSEISTVIAKE